MAELRAPEQNRLLGQLARMLRTTEGDIAAPEFLPKSLDVMGLVRQLMLPSAETVEKLSYGDPLFRMPTQSNIPITADREYLAEVLGMAPAVPAASRATTRLSNEAADQLVRAITRNPEATAPQVLEAAGQMLPLSRIVRENPEPFMVAHGTTEPFAEFKSGMGRTARDIYTVPESLSEDVSLYGSVLIKATASPKKMIDFSDYDKLDQQTISAIKKAAEDSGVTDEYYTFDSFLDDLMTGQLYQSGGGPRAQNNFLAELFSEYDAVKMPDARVGGGLSQSVVVQNPNLLKVKEVDGEPVEKVFPGLLDQPAQSVVDNPFQTAFTQVSPGDEVAGLTVREYVPNIDSISASLDNYEVLSGIRKVPARAFDAEYLDSLRDRGLDKRTADLSEQIKQSKEINPLIVAVDSKGAYIIEGGHRFDALMTQGRDSVPAKVVIDQDDPPTEDFLRSLFE
jgi:disulfide oxidoreductase YuzD